MGSLTIEYRASALEFQGIILTDTMKLNFFTDCRCEFHVSRRARDRYGFDQAAGELAQRSVALFLKSWRDYQLCRENYDSRTGEGGGQRPSAPGCLWMRHAARWCWISAAAPRRFST